MVLGTVNATVIFVPAKLPRFMTPLKGRHSVSPAHGGHSTPLPARICTVHHKGTSGTSREEFL